MTVPSLLVPFLLVVVLLTVTPGPDMVLVLRNGARGGARLAWWTGLGCCTGIAVHAAAAVLGLAALLAASATAFTVVKFVGAAYLTWLGLSALWHSRGPRRAAATPAPPATAPAEPEPAPPAPAVPAPSPHAPDEPAPTATPPAEPVPSLPAPSEAAPTATAPAEPVPSLPRCYRQGLLTNLLNPKIALLFLTLLPQFVAAGEPRTTTSAVLAGIFLVGAVLWWRLFSLGVGALAGLLSRPAVRTALERTTGVVLVGLGVRVALERS